MLNDESLPEKCIQPPIMEFEGFILRPFDGWHLWFENPDGERIQRTSEDIILMIKELRDYWEKKKDEYDKIFYCPKKNEIFLVKEAYWFVRGKSRSIWIDYADQHLFGKEIKRTRCKTWHGIGTV